MNLNQLLQHWLQRIEHLSSLALAEYTAITLITGALLIYSVFFVIYRTRFPQEVKEAAREGKHKLKQTKESAKEKISEISDKIKSKTSSSSSEYSKKHRSNQLSEDEDEDYDSSDNERSKKHKRHQKKMHRNMSSPFEDNVLKKLTTLRTSTSGGDGVWLATWKPQVVVKDYKLEATDDIHNELQMINQLHHPNLIPVYKWMWEDMGTSYGVVQKTSRKYRMIMEMGFCSLYDVVERYRKSERNLTLRSILRIFSQISEGMSFLHSKGILHGNLKLSNLIVFDCEDMDKMNKRPFTIKIADVGMGTLLENGFHPKNFDKEILPPESSRREWDLSVDVYEFGNILWQLIRIPEDFHEYFSTGTFRKKLDWSNEDEMDLKHAQELRFMRQNPHLMGPEKSILVDQLEQCWHILPEKRPSFDQLRQWSKIAFPLMDSLEEAVMEDRAEFLRWKTLNKAEKKINLSKIRANNNNEEMKHAMPSTPSGYQQQQQQQQLYGLDSSSLTGGRKARDVTTPDLTGPMDTSIDQGIIIHSDDIRPREAASSSTPVSVVPHPTAIPQLQHQTIHAPLPNQQKHIEIEVLHESHQSHLVNA